MLIVVLDPRVTGWFLMDSPVPVLLLVTSYILFVKRVGPWWMKGRPPYNVEKFMMLYNIVQMTINSYFVYVVSYKTINCTVGWYNYSLYRVSWINLLAVDVQPHNPIFIQCCYLGSHQRFKLVFFLVQEGWTSLMDSVDENSNRN